MPARPGNTGKPPVTSKKGGQAMTQQQGGTGNLARNPGKMGPGKVAGDNRVASGPRAGGRSHGNLATRGRGTRSARTY